MESMKDWQAARQKILGRLQEVQVCIARRDEVTARRLVNRQDEFCDLARGRGSGCAAGATPFCFFCEGFIQSQGCLDHLARINHALSVKHWDDAGRMVEDYARWLRDLALNAPA